MLDEDKNKVYLTYFILGCSQASEYQHVFQLFLFLSQSGEQIVSTTDRPVREVYTFTAILLTYIATTSAWTVSI